MKYYKIMIDGATECCIETNKNIYEILEESRIKDVEKIIEVDKNEAYEWYDVIKM